MKSLKNIVSACILSSSFLIYNGCASLNSNKSEGFVEIYGGSVDREREVKSRFDDFFDGHHSDEQNALGLGLAAGVNFPLTKEGNRRILLGPEFRFESLFGDKSIYDFRVGLRGTVDLEGFLLIFSGGRQLEWIPESDERDHHEIHIQHDGFDFHSFEEGKRKKYGSGHYVRFGLGIPLSKDKKTHFLSALTYSSSEFENNHETHIQYNGFHFHSHRNEDHKYKQREYSFGFLFRF